MDTNNPYQTPSSPAAAMAGSDDSYTPRVFALSGRIGRLRYLAYYTAATLAVMPLGVLAAVLGGGASNTAGMVLFAMTLAALVVFMLALGKRRLNDLNRSGWLLVLMLVPIVNVLFSLYLLFAPGTDGRNDYGPAPTRNGNFVYVGALAMPLLLIVGALSGPSLKKEPAMADSDAMMTAPQDAAVEETAASEPEPEMAEPAEADAPRMAAPAMAAPAPVEAASAYAPEYDRSEPAAEPAPEDTSSYDEER